MSSSFAFDFILFACANESIFLLIWRAILRDWLIQNFRAATLTATTKLVKKEAGTTVTTQTVSDDTVTQTLGPPS